MKGRVGRFELSSKKRAMLDALHQSAGTEPRASWIARRSGSEPPPLSFGQQRLWFLDQFQPGTAAYNMPGGLRLTGALDVRALEAALNEIVRRHQALRTTFVSIDGEPRQNIASSLHVPVPIVDVNGASPADRENAARRLAREEVQRPFDLERGPLVRATLLRLAPDDHVLLFTVHHIASDGWSMVVLTREFNALYTAFRSGRPSPLPELPIQYADFAVWQRDWLKDAELEAQLSYWRRQLAGIERLTLPLDHPRPPVQTFRGEADILPIGRSLTAAVQARSAELQVTPFMTLLAAFHVLLHRWTGQTDLVVGSPIANRTRTELEALIGFFVNSLALRTVIDPDESFRDLVGRVAMAAQDAFTHPDLPFERLVEELQPERDLSQNPIFQVMLAFQSAPVEAIELPGLHVEPFGGGVNTTRFDLELYVAERDGEWLLRMIYNRDLFEPATIRRMLEHYRNVLESAVAEPSARVADLRLLSEAERRILLEEWNATNVPHGANECVHALVARQAAAHPGATAVADARTEWTYAQLDARANQIARLLQAHGVGPEVPVIVLMPRSVEMIAALLGVLKAGGAYVPLDPSYPPARWSFALTDTGAPVVLTQSALAARLPAEGARVVCLDPELRPLEGISPAPVSSRAGLDNLAYVIYTSGSTGQPKGVEIAHRGLLNLIGWHQRTYGISPLDRATQLAGVGFDASVWEVWPYLAAGASIHLPDDDTILEPVKLWQWLFDRRVTISFLPTPLAEAALRVPMPAGLALRALLTGGDRLTRAPEDPLPFDLLNHYGPTENSVVSTWAPVRPGDAAPPIGQPIDNVTAYVLDANGSPVPIGVAGELYVGGASLARGYLRRADETARRFVPDPWGREPGARLYRTGDLVRYTPDGQLHFLGRADHQVKLRGFRIELSEIDAVVAQHPAVTEVVTLARSVRPGETELVSYVVADCADIMPDAAMQQAHADEGMTGRQRELLRQLRTLSVERLPTYMVPSTFLLLDAMPLTPNGKIDRGALLALEPVRASLDDTFLAPRTPTEEKLASIWAEVLRCDRVGVHDNFFAVGGHSLLATQVMSRIRGAFGLELPLRSLFETPTIAGLAATVEDAMRGGDGAAAAPPLVPVDRSRDLPLSFAQQRLWFLDRLGSAAAYHVPIALRLTGPLNVVALRQTVTEIVRRHESLRTTFGMRGDEPVQIVRTPCEVPMPIVDLAGEAPEARPAEAVRLAHEEERRRFDLSTGPMIRARLLRLAADDHVLLLTVHHIAADGWSLGVLFKEWTALYSAFSAGVPSPLPPLRVQYADFAAWQRQWLQGEVLAEQIRYWRDQLAGITPLQLPTDYARPSVTGFDGAVHAMILPPSILHGIAEMSRREGVTPYMILLAAFQTLLARYTAQDDIVVGSPIANRTRAETEGLIGFFVNSLVMRTDLSGDPTFLETLRRVREVALGAYAHQDVPFEKLVDELQPERDLSRNPLFQVSFVLQNAPVQDLDLGALTIGTFGTGTIATRFDLELHLWEWAGTYVARFYYSIDLFRAATIERMAAHFATLLEGAVSRPNLRLSELPLLTPAEERQLVSEWNDTVEPLGRADDVVDTFETQVERSPDAIAVQYGPSRVTYRELNTRANQLAHHLRAHGVAPDVLVGLCTSRSVEMLIGILGVLKAGGAYVPLDPSYPAERISFMLRDADVRLLVTEETLQPALPAGSIPAICLDAGWSSIAGWRSTNPTRTTDQANLAYVIYTSGSTGRPKGAMITHRGLANYLQWATQTYQGGPGRGAPVHSSIAFDLTVTSVFYPLLRGETVYLLPEEDGVDRLSTAIESIGQFGVIKITPAHLELLGSSLSPDEAVDAANAMVIGGEALLAETLAFWRTCAPRTRLINEYGPTETVVGCAVHEVGAGDPATGSIPIGRPIANTRLHVLDRNMNLTPVGVPGELFIGGAGVARGYLGRADLTAERFVPDPFAGTVGERLYRTGDLARYRVDGTLEYLGRIDHQVKIRGYRIELGEVEAVLAQHPAVRETAVVAREDEPGDRRLVAYVVADADRLSSDEPQRESEKRQVAQWQTLYEDTYGRRSADPLDDPTFDLTGWNSSYTGQPIPASEMREWVETTCERILSLGPRRVLEIGCGSGLLLFRIAPHVADYYATDFSETALASVDAALAGRDFAGRVTLRCQTADDLASIEPGSRDVVIVNSVAQYFPSMEYLLRTIEAAAATLAPGGSIFLGDLRSLPLLDAYHASIQLHRAGADVSRGELRARVRRRLDEEEELVIAPSFFDALRARIPRLAGVRTLLKRGRSDNELTRFRYDVILTMDNGDAEAGVPALRLDWQKDGLTLAAIRDLLNTGRPSSVAVTRVPDRRTADDVGALDWIERGGQHTLEAWLSEGSTRAAIHPEEFWQLEETVPYHVDVMCSCDDEPGSYDVIVWRHGSPQPAGPRPAANARRRTSWRSYGNDPLRAMTARQLVPDLRAFLQRSLPNYMLPSAYVVLDALPLTHNGKVDRAALPEPEHTRPDLEHRFVAARTPTEALLSQIWMDLLGLERVGIRDSFFDLGGHSLKATQLISRVRDAFGVEVSLRRVFDAPTIELLSTAVEQLVQQDIEALSEDEAARLVNEAESGV